MIDQSAKKYEVVNLSAKPYPCCRLTHGAIEATLSLAEEYGLQEKDVKEVVVETSPVIYDTVGHPFKIRDNPQVDTKFSISYTVAVAVQRGKVVLDDFEEEVVRQPKTAELAKKVLVKIDGSLPKFGTIVNILTIEGKSLYKRIEIFKGHPKNPLSKEEFIQKFRNCAKYSAVPIDQERHEEILLNLQNIEKIQDINQIVQFMV